MRRQLLWCVLVLLTAVPARADQKPPRLVEETWDAAYVEGLKTGFYHTIVHEIERDGRRVHVGGATRLEPGDEVVVFCDEPSEPAIRRIFEGRQ